MQLSMPTIDLPWRRKTPLERTQAELHRVQKQIAKQVDKIELPRIKSEDINAMVDETKKAVGTGVDQLAVAAGQIGREAGKFGRQAGKRGGELSRELARAGDQNLKGLRADLKGLGDDVRSLRITREKQAGPNMMPGIALLAGLGAGMAAMFFFDPEQGRRRRALLRDQLTKWSRVSRESLSGQMEDLRNRGIGAMHEVRRGVEGMTGSGNGQSEEDLAGTTPDASMELASTDAAATEQPVTPVGSAWSEEVSVPEASEGQPELNRPN